MAYASRSGRARTSIVSPHAHAICDRCGFRYNRSDLQWQFDWRGPTMQNIRILVCQSCLDTPQEQQRAIVLPADPVPIVQPRVQDFVAASTDYSTVSATATTDFWTGIPIPPTTTIVTQDGKNMTSQPLGIPDDIDQNAIMPLQGKTHYGVTIPILSVIANGTTVISVTCSSAHNLANNAQISVQGLSNNKADGLYNIAVTTATAFTYEIAVPIPSGNLVAGGARMVNANVGVPYNYDQVPQTGVPNG